MFAGIDLGNNTGVAVLDDAGRRLFSTTWKFKKRTPKASLSFHEKLTEVFLSYGVSVVGYERVLQGHKSRAAACAWGSWEGLLWLICAQLNLRIEQINVMEIKRYIGFYNADKEDAEATVLSKWDYVTHDDNEADSILTADITRQRVCDPLSV